MPNIEYLIDRTDAVPEDPNTLYTRLALPEPPADRPYTVVNMVSTVDGKILIGPPGSTAQGVGSPTDQLLMRRIQDNVQGAILGAGTLRAGNVVYQPALWRAVVTRSGELPLQNRFFTDAPDKTIIFAPTSLSRTVQERLSAVAHLRLVGQEEVDTREAVRVLRTEFGIGYLALEGGADLNFDFFEAGLVDELFLTFAPKLKGGAHLPTIVGGAGLPDREWMGMQLLTLYREADELYFRYRMGARQRG